MRRLKLGRAMSKAVAVSSSSMAQSAECMTQLRTEEVKVWEGSGGEALERKQPKHIISKRDSCK
jgi:hypothetical protein